MNDRIWDEQEVARRVEYLPCALKTLRERHGLPYHETQDGRRFYTALDLAMWKKGNDTAEVDRSLELMSTKETNSRS